jgi:putative permease
MDGTGTRILKFVIFIAVVAAALYMISLVGDIFKLLVIAAILAYIIAPLARYLEFRGMGRTTATAVIFAAFLAVVGLSFSWIVPHVVSEVKNVRLEVTAERATAMIKTFEGDLERHLAFLGVKDLNLLERLQDLVAMTGNQLYAYFLNAVSLLSSLLIIPFVMFFLLKDWRDIKKYAISLVPNRYFEFVLTLLHKTDRQLGGYLRGTFLDSLIIGILSIIALLALKVKYAILLGIFAGLSNMVPFIGPIFGTIPPVLVVMLDGGGINRALWVVLAFLAVQFIDTSVVKPVVVARMVSLHPIVVLLAVIIGGKFFGVLGMFLSVPFTSIIKVVTEETVRNFRKYQRAV